MVQRINLAGSIELQSGDMSSLATWYYHRPPWYDG